MTDPLTYLFALEQFGIKFGLGNIESLLASLGHPERAFPTIHIAGTNGKGSVAAMIDQALRAAGRRTGRYTSPHLVDLTERFVVDGLPITTAALVDTVARIRDRIETLRASGVLDVQPTFFEVTTAAAFELFSQARVDVATIEVGLGGRLDATNVVTPLVAAITSIALDHEQYLGHTLREIALEKAGIIKHGVPVVVGRLAPEADDAIAAVARERGADVIRAWDGVTAEAIADGGLRLRTPAHDYGDVRLALHGAHQVGNAVVAMRVLETLGARGLEVPAEAIARGLAEVAWPGRIDVRRFPDGRELLLDAAHNPAGAEALASYLAAAGAPRPLVFAAMRDKDVTGMLRALLPEAGALIVTRASNPRAADPAEIAAVARALAPALRVAVVEPPRDALAAAWRLGPRIVVAGSIFLLGDVLHEIRS